MPPPRLFGVGKMMARPIVARNNFQECLDIIRMKIRHLKGETKWEGSGRLNSNGLETEGPKAA